MLKPGLKMVLLTAALVVVAAIHGTPIAAQTCPEMVGRWPYGPATVLEVAGTTAYVAMGSTLKIIDITDPAAAVELGAIVVPGGIEGLTVSGSHAYVAAGEAGLRIIDVSTPAAPVEVAFDGINGRTTDVAVSGIYAYVTDGRDLAIFDISTFYPYPEFVGYFSNWTGSAKAVAVSGGHAFIAIEGSGPGSDLIVVDISDPSNPVKVGDLVTSATYSVDVVIDGTNAYLADETGLRVLDISDPTMPVEIGTYSPFSGIPKSIAIDGSYAYLGLGKFPSGGGVHVVDISTPTMPFLMASFDTPATASGISASGHQVSVAASSAGLRIFDWWQGTELAFVEAPGSSWDVAVSGTTAFLVDSEGLRVVDVSSPATPIELGFSEGGGNDIEIFGTHAFVTAGADGLRVFDVSNLTAPALVGSYNTPNWAEDVTVSAGFAYVADSNALRVVDVGIPTAPVEVGSLTMAAYSVAVAGSRAYVTDNLGLRVIDIADPMVPFELGALVVPGAWGLTVAGSHAYVAAQDAGLRVIDVSDPANPSEVGAFDSSNGLVGSPVHIALSGSVAYLTDASSNKFSGMSAVDVSIPTAPVEVGFAQTPGIARGLTTNGSHIFVADTAAGLTIFSQCVVLPDVIFAGDFEAGNTSSWSSTVP